jgi:filamentous hemagglutinin family protein
MNRNRYKLVFSPQLGMMVPQAETARSRGKATSSSVIVGALLASALLGRAVQAETPVPSAGGANPAFVGYGQAAYQINGNQALVNQVGNKSILNWQTFNLSAGKTLQFRQVDGLGTGNLVSGASFTSLNRIWDANPSVIAGSITQGLGQKANVILVNTNGIAFMGGAQVNLNSFTASSLGIADSFITNAFLGDPLVPQFEGTGGFVKVLEGATISADSQGRVMLLAPTVVNKGSVSAPDGQVILAAGTKVYLRSADDANLNVRGLLVEVDSPAGLSNYQTANTGVANGLLDGQAASLINASEDLLSHATNTGTLSSARGNVTMVGYAVNQMGIAKATTSVVANGSVYLMAKDTSALVGSSLGSSRSGRVVLGSGSLTQVLPESADSTTSLDGTTGTGLAQASEVRVIGEQVNMAAGATIDAPAGRVELIAIKDPSGVASKSSTLDLVEQAANASAQVFVGNGARINVAGVSGVQVSADRNTMEVELRGDELKDSPLNRSGALRGETVYVDVALALANANSGQATLIAKDSLESYQARIGRTASERSTGGGSVSIRSEGQTIFDAGSVVDLSGGSVVYTPATVKTSFLSASGKLSDIANASADVKYDGVASRYVIDYGRWNKKEVIDLGQNLRYDPGYTEGKNAGSLNIQSMGAAFLQGDVQGRTVLGDLQRAKGTPPGGAKLTLGTANVGASPLDYKLNQFVAIDSATAALPVGYAFGDTLSASLRNTLTLNTALLARDRVASLTVYSNEAVQVNASLTAPQGGSVSLVGKDLTIGANIDTPSGTINLAARNNVNSPLSDPLLQVADGVQLRARGAWVNELTGVVAGDGSLPKINGGSISLAADARATSVGYDSRGTVALGQAAVLDVSGGARLGTNGKVSGGNAGSLSLSGYAITGLPATLLAYGVNKGGKLILGANRIKIGGATENTFGTLNISAGFFANGGFGDYSLNALSTLELAANTAIAPVLSNRDLLAGYSTQATGAALGNFSQITQRDAMVRQAANISLKAKSNAVGSGELLTGLGSSITLDPRGTIALEAFNTLDIEGSLVAHGGLIDAVLDRTTGNVAQAINQNPLWLGASAVLDVSGVAQTAPDNQGLAQGSVWNGGTINLNAKSGYVIGRVGSQLLLSGAAPVLLGVPNESGGIGRMVGSDAGTLNVHAEEGILFDSTVKAKAGGTSNRGGVLTVELSKSARTESQGNALDAQARIVELAQNPGAQTIGLAVGVATPLTGTVRAQMDAAALQSAGFDRMRFSSRDAIALQDGLALGMDATLPLREVVLDAARIETQGGNAAIKADAVRLGNYDTNNKVGGNGAYTSTGALQVDARLLELAGNLRLRGMANSTLTGTETVQLAGVTRVGLNASGASTGVYENSSNIVTTGNLTLKGSVIAPSSYAQVDIAAAGKTVRFEKTDSSAPTQPLSALGKLNVAAANIEQAGNVWAPVGSVSLSATNALTLESGSTTSVAASAGSVLPLGQMQNGRDLVVNVNAAQAPKGQLAIGSMPEKAVRLSGNSVDLQSGASVNIAGGGNTQAYEFTVGPGGSKDILAAAGTYAILPGYKGGFAPTDAQEHFDRAAGESVYLSGVPGLADGRYTLLPAHYALLPGAMAVRVSSAGALLPGQAYTRQDGVRVAAGYFTDSRSGAPKDAAWSGFEVLTREQVLARSELALTSASSAFAGGKNLPQDAGRLEISTQGTLNLNASVATAAALSGRGAAVDISAPRIVVEGATPSGLDAGATHIAASKLNDLQANSLLIGGTRSQSGSSNDITAGSQQLTLANNLATALSAPEVLLVASDTLTLKAGSVIDAQGTTGDSGQYTSAGNGALVRAASTTASFTRTGSPDRSTGTLVTEATSVIQAADSIILDSTKSSSTSGTTVFKKGGVAVNGNLAVGATRINFGAAPDGTDGITYSQAALDALNSSTSLSLTSYRTFDFYGGVAVGGIDSLGKPTLQSLSLLGAGLYGTANAGLTASLRATNLTLANPANLAYSPLAPSGSGSLAILADTLTLGAGAKSVQGFGAVQMTANDLKSMGAGATGTAVTTVAAPVQITTARITGAAGSDQSIVSSAALTVSQRVSDRVLADVTSLGAKWALNGTSVDMDSTATLPSGTLALRATTGNVTLGANARVDVAGRSVGFYDLTRPTWGGTVQLVSDTGNVTLAAGALINVSGASGANGGQLVVRATNGQVSLASGNLTGAAALDSNGVRGDGARVDIDAAGLGNFSAINTALNAGGFDGERTLRARSGNIDVASGDTVSARTIKVAADSGSINVAGTLSASGTSAGKIRVYASGDANLLAGGQLGATSSAAKKDGGDIEFGSASGTVNFAATSNVNLAGGSGGSNGTLLLRALRNGGDVAVSGLDSTIEGARSVSVEAVKVYDNITTLASSGASSGATLSLTTITADNTAFATNNSVIASRLGKTGDATFHVRSGVEVRSSGDLTLGDGSTASNWNLKNSRASSEPGLLTLRAAGNLNINSNVSDGFNVATKFSSGIIPSTLFGGDSWSYRLVAGANSTAADPLVASNGGDVTLAAGKFIRTGTGNISIAAGRDIVLADASSAIYTAGRPADPLTGFVGQVTSSQRALFTQGGGDVDLVAQHNAVGMPSTQLYSEWLFRQGALAADGASYAASQGRPAWWVRFDQFAQGIATLGGGDVTVRAGNNVSNVSASAPTQGRQTSAAANASGVVKTGGGTVRVEAGANVLGGQYFADNGDVLVSAGDSLGSGQTVFSKPVYTVLAVGDGKVQVQAQNDLNVHAILNPHLLPQSYGGTSTYNIGDTSDSAERTSLFSTYGSFSSAKLASLSGNVTLHNPRGDSSTSDLKSAFMNVLDSAQPNQPYFLDLLSYAPPSLSAIAFQNDVVVHKAPAGGSLTLMPSGQGQLELLAKGSVQTNASITMSDRDASLLANAARPVALPQSIVSTDSVPAHAAVPVHLGDLTTAHIYAQDGDVSGVSQTYDDGNKNTRVNLAKAVEVRAGRDISDLTIQAQHANATDVSKLQAGRDVVFSAGSRRTDSDGVRVGGPGQLQVTAGRTLDLGTSGGIVSRGDLDNANLPSGGADIQVVAGTGASGLDVSGAISRLQTRLGAGSPDETSLWLARWITGNSSLSAGNAASAVAALAAQDDQTKRSRLVAGLYDALRTTGRDHNTASSAFAGDYSRGYAALELVFPGISAKNADGNFANYQGEVNLFASRIKTERGGNIDILNPGGKVVVGLANTPAALVNVGNNVLGIVTAGAGSVKSASRGDVLVNQSRILTVGGGDVMLWSSEGDIDAGKGKKTASAVPPPVIKIDSQGNVTQELQGAASGSGIGALSSGGVAAGDVDLIAPKGTVNAGDAGIRAGNLNIAAQAVLGADNIKVSGTSTGTPLADTGAVTASASGATNAGGDVSKTLADLSQSTSDAAKTAQSLKDSFKPTFVRVDVIGYGDVPANSGL